MGKLYKDIQKMIRNIKVIEQYNNFRQLDIEEDVKYLKEKINNLYNIKDTEELIKEFKWCSTMINSYMDVIDSNFKKYMTKEDILEINS